MAERVLLEQEMDFTLWYQRPFMDFMNDDRMSLPFMFGGGDYVSCDMLSWCLHSLKFLLGVVQSGFCIFEDDTDNIFDIVAYMLRTADKDAIEEAEETRLKYRISSLHAWEVSS